MQAERLYNKCGVAADWTPAFAGVGGGGVRISFIKNGSRLAHNLVIFFPLQSPTKIVYITEIFFPWDTVEP